MVIAGPGPFNVDEVIAGPGPFNVDLDNSHPLQILKIAFEVSVLLQDLFVNIEGVLPNDYKTTLEGQGGLRGAGQTQNENRHICQVDIVADWPCSSDAVMYLPLVEP